MLQPIAPSSSSVPPVDPAFLDSVGEKAGGVVLGLHITAVVMPGHESIPLCLGVFPDDGRGIPGVFSGKLPHFIALGHPGHGRYFDFAEFRH